MPPVAVHMTPPSGFRNCRGPVGYPPVRARQGRSSVLSVSLRKSVFYGAFVWACGALNSQKRRVPARAERGLTSRRPTTSSRSPAPRSGPARGGEAPLAFPILNRFCLAFLYGRAGRLRAQNGGSRPGQYATCAADYMPARPNAPYRLCFQQMIEREKRSTSPE